MSLESPPEPDALRRLAEIGATSVIVPPWHITDDADNLASVLDGLSRFGDTTIARDAESA